MSSQYLQKSIGGEVDFFAANKHESFLHWYGITLGLECQAYSKHAKQVYNIFVISQGKREG